MPQFIHICFFNFLGPLRLLHSSVREKNLRARQQQ